MARGAASTGSYRLAGADPSGSRSGRAADRIAYPHGVTESPAMLDPALQARLLERVAKIPIVPKLGMEFVAWAEGSCTMRVPYDPSFDGVFESFHGGILMTIADSAACFAVMTLTGPDQVLTTTDMNIRFLAPCLSAVTVTARVVKLGRTMVPVTVDLFDATQRHIALAQVNYIRLAAMPKR